MGWESIMFKTGTDQSHVEALYLAEGLNYAGGWVDGRGEPWRQDEVWTFALAWVLLNRMEVSRKTIKETYTEWRDTGTIAYSVRGRKRWIQPETRKGTTGVVTMALPAEIGEGDVIVCEPGLSVHVETVSRPYRGYGSLRVTAHGRKVESHGDGALASVDMSPDVPVEVSRLSDVRASMQPA